MNKFTLTFRNTIHSTGLVEQTQKVFEEFEEFEEELSDNFDRDRIRSELKDLIQASLKLLTEHFLDDNETLQEFWDREDIKNEKRGYYAESK